MSNALDIHHTAIKKEWIAQQLTRLLREKELRPRDSCMNIPQMELKYTNKTKWEVEKEVLWCVTFWLVRTTRLKHNTSLVL